MTWTRSNVSLDAAPVTLLVETTREGVEVGLRGSYKWKRKKRERWWFRQILILIFIEFHIDEYVSICYWLRVHKYLARQLLMWYL